MHEHRTMRRSFTPRLEAERRWQQLYQLLLEIGIEQLRPGSAADDPAVVVAASLEVPCESRRLTACLNPTTGRGSNHCTADRTPPGPGSDGGLDA
jgi:hypothetical protein